MVLSHAVCIHSHRQRTFSAWPGDVLVDLSRDGTTKGSGESHL